MRQNTTTRSILRSSLSLLLFFLLQPQGAAAETTGPLVLEVTVDGDSYLGGADVLVEGPGGHRQTALVPFKENLKLDLPPGTYDVTVSHNSYYDLTLKQIVVPPAEAKQPGRADSISDPLRIMMVREVLFAKDLIVIGNRHVEAPPLEVSFQPLNPIEGQPARAVVTISNHGEETVLVPLERKSTWTPKSLTMRINVEVEGSSVWFDEAFLCEPSKDDCRELHPGEFVKVPIELQHRSSYGDPEWIPARWDAEGDPLRGSVIVYFAYPEDEDSPRAGAYSQPVEASFVVRPKGGIYDTPQEEPR